MNVFVCVRRPFQRTITMHKDSSGHVGFIYKSGKITSLVKDGSAARNGLLTEHYICEINGQNVIGLKVRKTPSMRAGYTTRLHAAVCCCLNQRCCFGPFRILRSRTF